MEWPLSAFLPDTEVYCTPPPPPMVEEGQRLMGLNEDDGMGRSKRGQGAGMCTCECVLVKPLEVRGQALKSVRFLFLSILLFIQFSEDSLLRIFSCSSHKL